MKPKKRPTTEPPTDVELKPSTYQPTKEEKEETQDMPGWSLEAVKASFFKPFRVKECD